MRTPGPRLSNETDTRERIADSVVERSQSPIDRDPGPQNRSAVTHAEEPPAFYPNARRRGSYRLQYCGNLVGALSAEKVQRDVHVGDPDVSDAWAPLGPSFRERIAKRFRNRDGNE